MLYRFEVSLFSRIIKLSKLHNVSITQVYRMLQLKPLKEYQTLDLYQLRANQGSQHFNLTSRGTCWTKRLPSIKRYIRLLVRSAFKVSNFTSAIVKFFSLVFIVKILFESDVTINDSAGVSIGSRFIGIFSFFKNITRSASTKYDSKM